MIPPPTLLKAQPEMKKKIMNINAIAEILPLAISPSLIIHPHINYIDLYHNLC
jgi:hypothetical protein